MRSQKKQLTLRPMRRASIKDRETDESAWATTETYLVGRENGYW